MSEYQYYEFQAIDRPLSEKEMAELRSHSTRARITPTSFVNDYSWGDFKGDENAWMAKYFDAFLYVANPGHPHPETAAAYAPSRRRHRGALLRRRARRARERNGKVILTFQSEDEEGGEWIEGEGQLASLISVRAELARSDRRALYLGWLVCAQSGDFDDEEVEPPVPAGAPPSSARRLRGLSSFFASTRISFRSPPRPSSPLADGKPKPAEIRRWLAGCPLPRRTTSWHD